MGRDADLRAAGGEAGAAGDGDGVVLGEALGRVVVAASTPDAEGALGMEAGAVPERDAVADADPGLVGSVAEVDALPSDGERGALPGQGEEVGAGGAADLDAEGVGAGAALEDEAVAVVAARELGHHDPALGAEDGGAGEAGVGVARAGVVERAADEEAARAEVEEDGRGGELLLARAFGDLGALDEKPDPAVAEAVERVPVEAGRAAEPDALRVDARAGVDADGARDVGGRVEGEAHGTGVRDADAGGEGRGAVEGEAALVADEGRLVGGGAGLAEDERIAEPDGVVDGVRDAQRRAALDADLGRFGAAGEGARAELVVGDRDVGAAGEREAALG